jgi:hypothetical protein
MRYIVCADLHGNAVRYAEILRHSKYSQNDQLICLGDVADIGPESIFITEDLIKKNAILLPGNHEIAHLLGHQINPYDHLLDQTIFNSLWNKLIVEKRAQFIIEIEGFILSHSGVSSLIEKKFIDNLILFNDTLYEFYIEKISFNDFFYSEAYGPTWFRPYDYTDPYPGIKQVIGHTPWHSLNPRAKRDPDLFCIDGYSEDGSAKYAVIEDGNIEVIKFNPAHPIPKYKFR